MTESRSTLRIVLFRLLFLISIGFGLIASGQDTYVGNYSGYVFKRNASQSIVDESGFGPMKLTIDSNGTVTQTDTTDETYNPISGTVDIDGIITWDRPNAYDLETGQIAGRTIIAEQTTTIDGTDVTFRLEAPNETPGFDGTLDRSKLRWRSPAPSGNAFNAIIHDGTQFIGVTNGGGIWRSPEGTTWKRSIAPVVMDLHDVAYGNGTYVVVGANATLHSTNAVDWTEVGPGQTTVAFGAGLFMAMSTPQTAVTSTDGITWSTTLTGIAPVSNNATVTHLDFLNDRFVGSAGIIDSFADKSSIIVSNVDSQQNPTAYSWTVTGIPFVRTKRAAFGNGTYVVTAENNRVFTSNNGFQWSQTNLGFEINNVTFDGTRFIAIATNQDAYTSSNGQSWTYAGAIGITANDLAYATIGGESVYLGAGYGLTVSSNREDWTDITNDRSIPTENVLNSRLVGAGRIVGSTVDASNSSSEIIYSDDRGVTWKSQSVTDVIVIRAYGNNTYIATKNDGTTPIRYSTNGVTYKEAIQPPLANVEVHFANGQFISTDGSDRFGFSTDGNIWTNLVVSQRLNFHKIVFANGYYVGLSDANDLYRSTDAINWEKRLSNAQFNTLAYGNGIFVTTAPTSGNLARIVWSDDNLDTFTTQVIPAQASNDNDSVTDLTFVSNQFVGLVNDNQGDPTTLLTGELTDDDGTTTITWTESQVGLASSAWKVDARDGLVLISGNMNNKPAILSGEYADGDRPTIVSDPANQPIAENQDAILSVSQIGKAPFTYVWFKNGIALTDGGRVTGTATDTLTISGAQPSDEGVYTVRVRNDSGEDFSRPASVDIVTQPTIGDPESNPRIAQTGDPLTLSVHATDPTGMIFSWYRNNVLIAQTSTNQLQLAKVTGADAGIYRVRATNAAGSVEFPSFPLSVATGQPRLVFDDGFNLEIDRFSSLTSIRTLAPLSDGRLLLTGEFEVEHPNKDSTLNFAIIDADGQVEDLFDLNVPDPANALVYRNLNETENVVAGFSTETVADARDPLQSIQLTGTLNPQPISASQDSAPAGIFAMMEDQNNRIYVTGDFTEITDGNNNNNGPNYLARLNSDLSLDTNFKNFGVNLTRPADAMTLLNNQIIAVLETSRLYRLKETGPLEHSYSGDLGSSLLNSPVTWQPRSDQLAADNEDRVYVANQNKSELPTLLRFTDSGLDTSFVPDMAINTSTGVAAALEIPPNLEQIWVATTSSAAEGSDETSAYDIRVFDFDGTTIESPIEGHSLTFDGPISALLPDGKNGIYALGPFSTIGALTRHRLVHFAAIDIGAKLPLTFVEPQPVRYAQTGGEVSLQAVATGDLDLQYQWKRNNQSVGTSPELILSNVSASDGGVYTVTVTDASNSPAITQSITLIIDDVSPVIEIDGGTGTDLTEATISLSGVSEKVLLGISATDDAAGDLTNRITVGGIPDPAIAGDYLVSYDVSDTAGNAATQRTRIYHLQEDVTAPEIQFEPEDLILYLEPDLSYTDADLRTGLTATDDLDGDLTSRVVVTGTYDLSTVGEYTLSYSVADDTGNETLRTRLVSIRNDYPYFTKQPAGLRVRPNRPVTLEASLTGSTPLLIKWLKNGIPIPLTNSPTFTIPSVTVDDAGIYTVQAKNALGTTTSAPATLEVIHRLTVEIDGPGSTLPYSPIVAHNTTVNLRAIPREGYEFVAWRGDQTSNNSTLTFAMQSDSTLQAVFAPPVPSQWLLNNGLPTDANLDADPDGDGLTTREEYEHGTNPTVDEEITFTLSLHKGSNFISLPLQPDLDADPLDVLDGHGRITGLWTFPIGSRRLRRIRTIKARRAFWIVSQESYDVVITGQPVTDTTLVLQAGWNPVGSPLDGALLKANPDLVGTRLTWNPDHRGRSSRESIDAPFVRGKGYFVLTRKPTAIEFQPAQ